MKTSKLILAIAVILLISFFAVRKIVFAPSEVIKQDATGEISSATSSQPAPLTDKQVNSEQTFSSPISDSLTRVTKKHFGLYVTPQNSPVKPEKFSGYHTGVDFETTAAEQASDVPIYALCDGPLILKKIATGYGGVALQACELNKEPITVIYGHLRFASIKSALEEKLTQGQQIGFLGKGYSAETSGERKHLHLGVHKGKTINILGYVQKESDLSSWLDVLTLLK